MGTPRKLQGLNRMSIYGKIKLFHTMPKSGMDPCVNMEWKTIFVPTDVQLLYRRGIGNCIVKNKDSRHNFPETKSTIWCCRSFILMSSLSLSSSLSILCFFWTFMLPTMALICSVSFFCENLSEYEGFWPWQGFIFVEIFVIKF